MPKLDPFERVENLQAVGFTPEQGQALVQLISDIQTEQLVTKADIVETREILRTEVAGLRAEMATKSEVAALKSKVTALEVRLIDKITAIQTKLILWKVGTGIGIVALVAGIFRSMK